mgnify:CR=1 FL=1
MEKLKKCSKCGRELPVSEFWKNASTEDGLQTYCKECGNVYARNRKKTPGGGGNLKKIYSNPELAKFSPRELIAELKARGYTGELKYTQTISLNIIINGKVTSIGYNQMSEQMSYVLQQLMGFFKITSC